MTENNKGIDWAKGNNRDIELRSEKVRNIVGKIPPVLLRAGTTVISIIILAVLILAYLIPYPEYRDITVELYSDTPAVAERAADEGLFDASIREQHVNRGKFIGNMYIGDVIDVIFYNKMLDEREKKERMGLSDLEYLLDTTPRIYAGITGYAYFQKQGRNHVRKGEIMYAIIPDTISEIYGICRIPHNEVGKVKEGQEVSVTLSGSEGWPKREPVLIDAHIRSIYPFAESSDSNKDNYYKVEISGFPDSLRTCRDKWFLLPGSGFHGKILLSDKPVLKKILWPDQTD